MITDKDLVKLCLSELRQKMQYDDGYMPSQSDLEHLCFLLEEKSRIVISLSTLKRIFQGKFERLPQASTLDAITIFLGYTGWQGFKVAKTAAQEPALSKAPQLVTAPGKRSYFNRQRYSFVILATLVILFAGFALFRSAQIKDSYSAGFSIKKIVSDSVPKSVIFDYNIDKVEGDSFFIQPSWNWKIKRKISKGNYTQTETYYEPGFHTAKLICDGRVLKEVPVDIPTSDWIAYKKVRFTDPYPEYFSKESINMKGFLGFDETVLRAHNIEINDKKIYYFAHFPKSLNLSSDNFILRARMRMKPLGSTLCPWIICEAYSQNSFFYFKGTIPGCTSEVEAVFSDVYLNGKTNDLSSFGFDVTKWNYIEIKSNGKAIAITINGKKAIERKYNRAGGPIVGLGFGSNGLCEIDDIELTDATGKIAYANDFTIR